MREYHGIILKMFLSGWTYWGLVVVVRVSRFGRQLSIWIFKKMLPTQLAISNQKWNKKSSFLGYSVHCNESTFLCKILFGHGYTVWISSSAVSRSYYVAVKAVKSLLFIWAFDQNNLIHLQSPPPHHSFLIIIIGENLCNS